MSESSAPRLSAAAVLAFVLGLSSLALSLLTAIPALYVGLRAVRAINSGDGELRGRRLAVAGLVLGGFTTLATIAGSLALVFLHLQVKNQLAGCANNLRQIGFAVNKYHDHHDKRFPSAVVANAALPPKRCLSWQAAIVPFLSEGTPAGARWEKLAGEIALKDAWDADANADPRNTNAAPFLCPSFVRDFAAGRAGLTSYVGVAGVGVDAATLPKKDPRAGFFGYDRVLTLPDITAGISSTMMAVETTRDNGPWLAGGPPTVRGIDPNCAHYIGFDQPFGGLHRDGLNVLWADGSVRFMNDKIAPTHFRALALIARGAEE